MTDERFNYWTYREFNLISLQLTNAYDAMFSETVDGVKVTDAVELDAIGIARCIEYEMRRLKSNPQSKGERLSESKYTIIVGLYLDDSGEWGIADECSNYEGMKKRELAQ